MSNSMDLFKAIAIRAEPNGPLAIPARIEAQKEKARQEYKDRRPEPVTYDSLETFADAVTSPREYARRMAHEMEHNPEIAELGMSMAERTHWLKQHAEKWTRMAEKRRAAQGTNQEATPDGDL